MTTLFEHYGGFATVSRVVSEFYDRVLDVPELARYFRETDMASLIDHQTKLIASLMGGPASYSKVQLAKAHANIGVKEPDFMTVVEILRETLEDFDVTDADISTLIDEVMSFKQSIVSD